MKLLQQRKRVRQAAYLFWHSHAITLKHVKVLVKWTTNITSNSNKLAGPTDYNKLYCVSISWFVVKVYVKWQVLKSD